MAVFSFPFCFRGNLNRGAQVTRQRLFLKLGLQHSLMLPVPLWPGSQIPLGR